MTKLETDEKSTRHCSKSELPTPEDDISLGELLRWLEFGGWTTLALVPMLYFINGPAVSPDQFVMRCVIVVTAIVLGPLRSIHRRWKLR